MGITPYDNQSSIGLYYRMRSFNGYYASGQQHNPFPSGKLRTAHGGHGSGSVTAPVYSGNDFEEYRVLELRGKYFIHHRIELNVILPYVWNSAENEQSTIHVSGTGDFSFFAGCHVIRPDEAKKLQQRLIAGAGIKLPSGNPDAHGEDGARYDALLQSGTGTTDYFIYANYILGFRKSGLSAAGSWKWNGENKFNEAVAPGLAAYLNLFYKIKAGSKMLFIPSIQGYYEYTKGIMVNGVVQPGTSMNTSLAGPGIEIFYDNLSLSGLFQIPLYEQKDLHRMGSAGRIMIGLTYNFNQRNYLLKKEPNNFQSH